LVSTQARALLDGTRRGEVLILVLTLGLLVELELARAATHFFYRGRVLFYAATTPRSALRIDMEKVKLLKI